MIDKDADLSVKAQCRILCLNRTSLHYSPKTRNEGFLEEEIVKIYIDKPFYGYRRIHNDLIRKNINIGEKKVITIEKRLNLKTIYPKPSLSIANKEHEKYPYLLKNKQISSTNQV